MFIIIILSDVVDDANMQYERKYFRPNTLRCNYAKDSI